MKKVFALLFILGCAVVSFMQSGASDIFTANVEDAAPVVESPKPCRIYVYVTGAVRKPGLYSFADEIRVGDVIHEAGDIVAYGDDSAINMAEKIRDGMHVHVSYNLEGVPAGQDELNGLININEADEKKLTELPGIGPAMAKNIIEYRTAHGAFTSPEDLRKVKGIGQAKFDKLKNKVAV